MEPRGTVCTYRRGGHAAGVSQTLLHPHRGVQESLHAEIPEDRPEVLAHLAEAPELLIERLALLQTHVHTQSRKKTISQLGHLWFM